MTRIFNETTSVHDVYRHNAGSLTIRILATVVIQMQSKDMPFNSREERSDLSVQGERTQSKYMYIISDNIIGMHFP